MICNACGLYLKARNVARPANRHKGGDANNSDQSTTLSPSPPDTTTMEHEQQQQQQKDRGSCPGGGNCNGTGGADGCDGCPAYNNRMYKAAQRMTNMQQASSAAAASSTANTSPAEGDSNFSQDPESPEAALTRQRGSQLVQCQNCGTTVTPLWRRDDNGFLICNACGMSLLPSPVQLMLTSLMLTSFQDCISSCTAAIDRPP